MSESRDHAHDDSVHYHGEPSRTLSGEPFPEAAVLYSFDSGPISDREAAGIQREDLAYWLDQLRRLSSIDTLYAAAPEEGVKPPDSLELRSLSPRRVEFLHPDFQGFDERIETEAAVLFLPATLRIAESAWDDLKSNDVTVNWLSVDPDAPGEGSIHVVVLSDWVFKVRETVEPARSSGVTPGIFQLTGDTLAAFGRAARSAETFSDILGPLLQEEGVKFRPGFLRGASWTRSPRDA